MLGPLTPTQMRAIAFEFLGNFCIGKALVAGLGDVWGEVTTVDVRALTVLAAGDTEFVAISIYPLSASLR